MRFAKRTGRLLLLLAIAYLSSLVLFVGGMRFATVAYRHRCARLMADFQSLELHKTSWSETQRMMTRWGRHGRYEGTCDANFCRYTIRLGSPIEQAFKTSTSFAASSRSLLIPLALYFHPAIIFGNRPASFMVSFVVQGNVVLRKGDSFTVGGSGESTLVATSHSADRVNGGDPGWLISGTEQLATHPYYSVSRPGGCSTCSMVQVVFSLQTPTEQARSLTRFNFECIGRIRPCKYMEEIFPASAEWNLYDRQRSDKPDPENKAELPVDCRVPLFARAREADAVLRVMSLARKEASDPDPLRPPTTMEQAHVRIIEKLKGGEGWQIGTELLVYTHPSLAYQPRKIEVPLTAGSTFYLLQTKYPMEAPDTVESGRCLTIPDLPGVRAQLRQGIQKETPLRVPDPWRGYFKWGG
ncbi:hypothetical protein Terro_3786 [Terriglobus roseus DSM 18391]|uniref:Uncharacterized protein n=1 Tax=Terriglobus roseus (strain DSM 18391 / NRRL B-41598 / KBS 63) TaxID=926566 RepID=I3ZL78_TERRK|nr:hypothetical protein [Terriglobus roseus]AFL89996.1 hypothetical protein Terro_3786 [Terriglobus roseus DSM 18391]